MPDTFTIITVVSIILLICIIFSGYIKARPDQALIITGYRKQRILIGKSGIRIPLLERVDRLSLNLIGVEVDTKIAVPTKDFINVQIDGSANIKISDKPHILEKAAQNFLNKPAEYGAGMARQVLEANMREIIGTMTVREIAQNKERFAQAVQDITQSELSQMGLEVINLNIQSFKDDHHVLENLGAGNITVIKKEAEIAMAESQKEVRIAQAKASEEANNAEVRSQYEIAQKNNELALKVAELRKQEDAAKAIADISYEIAKESQRIELEQKTAEANIKKKDLEVEVEKKTLDATIREKANASRYEMEQKAIAEANAIREQARANIELAESIRAVGDAEAEVARKKANALNDLAILNNFIEHLPEAVAAASKPLEKVEKIVMFGEGNASKFISDNTKSVFSIGESLKESVGLDLNAIINTAVGVDRGLAKHESANKKENKPIENNEKKEDK